MGDIHDGAFNRTVWNSSSGKIINREKFHLKPAIGLKANRQMSIEALKEFLLPSDIICMSNENHVISKYCSDEGYEGNSASITHCALYTGEGSICHVVGAGVSKTPFGGVAIHDLFEYTGLTPKKYRRSARYNSEVQTIYVLRDKALSYRERADISLAATAMLSKPTSYDFGTIIQIAKRWLNSRYERGITDSQHALSNILERIFGSVVPLPSRFWDITRPTFDSDQLSGGDITPEKLLHQAEEMQLANEIRSFICSEFIVKIYSKILREKSPFNIPYKAPYIIPADIFSNENLSTVSNIASEDPNLIELDKGLREKGYFEFSEESAEVINLHND